MTNPSHEADVSMFSVGTILGHTFSTFFKQPLVFIGLLLASAPLLIILTLVLGDIIASVIYAIFILAFQCVVAYSVYEVLRGNTVRFGKVLSLGMARVGPAILVALSIIAVFFLIGGLGGAVVFIATMLGADLLALFIVVPLVSFIVTWMICKFAVAVPVCAIEGLGPIESLKRSSELTKGCLLKISVLYVLYSIISALMGIVVILASIIMPGFFSNLLSLIVGATSMSLGYVMAAIIYFGLREIKEGFSVDESGTGNRDPLPR